MTTTTSFERVPVGEQLAAMVARNLRTTARVPQLLMFSLTMPMAMLVLFSQVFRSVADGPDFPPGVSYIDFVTPAMLAVTTVMAGTNAGVAAAIDHTNGLYYRFVTLPMPPALPGLARTINETVFAIGRAAILLAGAALLGFRFHGDPVDAVAGLTVLVVLAGAMSALFGRIGDRLRGPDVVQFAGDDGDDAVHVHVQRLRPAGHHGRLDADPRRAQPGRPRRRRPARQRARHRHLGDTLIALAAATTLWIAVTTLPGDVKRRTVARRVREPSV